MLKSTIVHIRKLGKLHSEADDIIIAKLIAVREHDRSKGNVAIVKHNRIIQAIVIQHYNNDF